MIAWQAAIIALLITTGLARAEERVDICAEYSATGKTYHVTANSVAGSELNQAAHSFDYNSLSQYIVIFWAQNQASVIDNVWPVFWPGSLCQRWHRSGRSRVGNLVLFSSYVP